MKISEQQFQGMLEAKLGEAWQRALKVFRDYGPRMAYDVTNVLLHATERGQVEEVLRALEEHFAEVLNFQHPDIRGTVSSMGVNPTQVLFTQKICVEILGLQQASSEWPEKAQEFLDKLYQDNGVATTEEKVALIERTYGRANISSATGPITREQVLRVYEHGILEKQGLIEVILV